MTFFVFFFVSLTLFHALRTTGSRQAVLLGINAVFIGSFAPSLISVLPLFGFVLLGYGLIRILHRHPRQDLLFCFIVILVLLFAYLKRYSIVDFLPELPFACLSIGLSYILFRMLQLLLDLQSGALTSPPGLALYLNYIFFFLNFISGPIQRHQDFLAQWHGPGLEGVSREEIFSAFSRILDGIIKVSLFSVLLLEAFNAYEKTVLMKIAAHGTERFGLMFAHGMASLLYLLYLYMNFSGYMDMVIGCGRLFGFVLPENFNRPFQAENFLELWSRWHITLSEWFKWYFFNPLLKWLKYRLVSPVIGPYLVVLCLFATFLLLGVWHGTTKAFLLFGLLQAIGTSANKLYQLWTRAWLGRDGYGRLKGRHWYRALCRGLMFSYFSLSLTCLFLDAWQIRLLVEGLGVEGLAGAFFGVVGASIMLLGVVDVVQGWWNRRMTGAVPLAHRFFVGNMWLATKVMLLFNALWMDNASPVFVYQGF
ncbi:MAG: hypothetical protein HQM02_06405 [Magnetococcales bacterium]|nr:hypothetical protein [Magnetococcales bacterium]